MVTKRKQGHWVGEEMPSQPITQYQFEKLLELTKQHKNKFIAERDSLYYLMLLLEGLRPSEARLIKISEINFEEKTLFIPAGNNKEHHEDNFPIPNFLLEKIKAYIKKIPFKTQWLFPCALNVFRKRDSPVPIWNMQKNFYDRINQLGFRHISFYDKHNFPRYNLNLYSFRKRFGTNIYKKTKDAQITALMLRQYDRQLKSVWNYIFNANKEERKKILEIVYSKAN